MLVHDLCGVASSLHRRDGIQITATDARRELMRLTAERLDARETGQVPDASYLTELGCEIDECRLTYELLALTEIASLRAELFGPHVG